ncbi:hypothetical protein LQ327_15715 [Actinomycetospora endophytica]|uniref:AAA domain-containing protein n=1 Tax=Actinomycetospora endophytica TaxID=2291215 RepID=A0ABS8P983_9PSEU|nr:hypothetical protein [Actinomycetospora endophytica]MCD2194819.1 hypothetical protein [Actinomycetospora endophytica]
MRVPGGRLDGFGHPSSIEHTFERHQPTIRAIPTRQMDHNSLSISGISRTELLRRTGAADDEAVIIAVEGPSAAGKTTWCHQQEWPVVPEYTPTDHEPDGSDEERRAAYWTDVNVGRWHQAVRLEQQSRVVLCDSDPLKLHYAWCLARVGAAPWSRFEHELRHARAAFGTGRLGLADVALVFIPAPEILQRRWAQDSSRRRRSFGLHQTLGPPLREWYRAVERVAPGRVIWSFPSDGVRGMPSPRPQRSDPELLERILTALPDPTE